MVGEHEGGQKVIPKRTRDNIDRYVKEHHPPGSFLIAVLSNDLVESIGWADEGNREALFEIVGYCYNMIPSECWGSRKAVRRWLMGDDNILIE